MKLYDFFQEKTITEVADFFWQQNLVVFGIRYYAKDGQKRYTMPPRWQSLTIEDIPQLRREVEQGFFTANGKNGEYRVNINALFIACGGSDVAILDLDTDEMSAQAILDELQEMWGFEVDTPFMVTTSNKGYGPGLHIYFDNRESKLGSYAPKQLHPHADTRSIGQGAVIFGQHPITGDWHMPLGEIDLNTPLHDQLPAFPERWKEYLQKHKKATNTQNSNIRLDDLDDDFVVKEGRRDNTMTSFIGKKRRELRYLRDEDALEAALMAFARKFNERFDPPLDEADLERICHSMMNYDDPPPTPLVDLNEANNQDYDDTQEESGENHNLLWNLVSTIWDCDMSHADFAHLLALNSEGNLRIADDKERTPYVFTEGVWCPSLSDFYAQASEITTLIRMCSEIDALIPERWQRIREADQENDTNYFDKQRSKLYAWAVQSKKSNYYSVVRKEHAAHLKVLLAPDQWNQEEFYINVKNGIVDLRTGELQPHKPEFLFDAMAGGSYDLDAPCPRWIQFLDEIYQSDESLIKYVQKLVGYSLYANNRDRIMIVLQGQGANGKSVFAETIQAIFEGFVGTAESDAFMTDAGSSATFTLASMAGQRIVILSEQDAKQEFSPRIIKMLTGDNKFSARPIYGSPKTYNRTMTLWFLTNSFPSFRDTSGAFAERLRVIPHARQFARHERDPFLADKLAQEADGILTWAIEGASLYYKEGLGEEPTAVKEKTQQVVAENDAIARWLKFNLIVSPENDVAVDELLHRNAFTSMSADDIVLDLTARGYTIEDKRIKGYRVASKQSSPFTMG